MVYIDDLDIMFNAFLTVRARPTAFRDVSYKFENITFLLNVVDYLTKEVDYGDPGIENFIQLTQGRRAHPINLRTGKPDE